MKQIDNRQNKLIQIKAGSKQALRPAAGHDELAQTGAGQPAHGRGGPVLGLVADLLVAGKIAQAARHCHLACHNSDHGDALMAHARQKRPAVILVDWNGCEAEAFKFLNLLRQDADLRRVPVVGYLSQSKSALLEEARKAGCDRLYPKTEFLRTLEEIIARYAS